MGGAEKHKIKVFWPDKLFFHTKNTKHKFFCKQLHLKIFCRLLKTNHLLNITVYILRKSLSDPRPGHGIYNVENDYMTHRDAPPTYEEAVHQTPHFMFNNMVWKNIGSRKLVLI